MKKLQYLMLLFWLINLACKESPSEPKPEPPQFPNNPLAQIRFPTNAPSPVKEVVDEITTDIAGCFFYFDLVKDKIPAAKPPDWTWGTRHRESEVTIKARVQGENSVSWEIILNGGTYNNMLYLAGTTHSDSKSGSLNLFSQTRIGEILIELTWSRNEQDVLLVGDNNPDPLNPQRFDLIGYPDGSGSLIMKEKDTKIFMAIWDASGAGSWFSYNPGTGQQTGSGTWR